MNKAKGNSYASLYKTISYYGTFVHFLMDLGLWALINSKMFNYKSNSVCTYALHPTTVHILQLCHLYYNCFGNFRSFFMLLGKLYISQNNLLLQSTRKSHLFIRICSSSVSASSFPSLIGILSSYYTTDH